MACGTAMSSELAAQAIREAGVCDGLDPAVNELLATVGLVDHHVHGVVKERVDDATLCDMLGESDRRSAAQAKRGRGTAKMSRRRNTCQESAHKPCVERRLLLASESHP